MSEFQELIKRFDKCRDYVRDFFVYGFKSRNDFSLKSARTYDDERRRIESWLSDYVRQDYAGSKNISLQMDSSLLDSNPLYRVWKAKSFTDSDIQLHFYLLDLLRDGAPKSVNQLTDELISQYGFLADSQMVRRKCNEYVKEGLFRSQKEGKMLLYQRGISFDELAKDCAPALLNAIRFYQLSHPFSVVGSTILDQLLERNPYFRIKHRFVVHTLENEILLELLSAMRSHQYLRFSCRSNKNDILHTEHGLPLQIFTSTKTGRRYICLYRLSAPRNNKAAQKAISSGLSEHSKLRGRFIGLRLDQIKKVEPLSPKKDSPRLISGAEAVQKDYEHLKSKLEQNKSRLWGISFSCYHPYDKAAYEPYREQCVRLTLHINEKTEGFLLRRLQREGKGGCVQQIEKDTYLYEKIVFDPYEMFPWLRTFIGRIIDLKIYGVSQEGEISKASNRFFSSHFQKDLEQMYRMYEI